MEKKFCSSKDICMKFGWSSRTLYRRRKAKINPFPKPHPAVSSPGFYRWRISDIEDWEEE